MPFKAFSTGKGTAAFIRVRFKQWLKASGRTQAEAGYVIEWEQQTVSAYFAGGQQIDLVRAVAWCEYFGFTVEALMRGAPKPVLREPKLSAEAAKLQKLSRPELERHLRMVKAVLRRK